MKEKEAKARIKINQYLQDSGWRFLDSPEGKHNIELEPNIKGNVIKNDDLGDDFEKTSSGFIDYLLYDSKGFPLVVLEAKKSTSNPLYGKEQARRYAQNQNCRFVILSNGDLHYLWDLSRGNPNTISKFPTLEMLESFSSFKPDKEALICELVDDKYIAKTQKHDFEKDPNWVNESKRAEFIRQNKLRLLRKYQIKAINSIQNAVSQGRDRFLFEMATGTGKTLVSAAIIKLFLRTGNAKRVLFLVDRIELEDQAEKSFKEVLSNDYQTRVYKKSPDDWRKAEIVVSTVQTLLSGNRYKREFAPDSFDLVISDEAHRSIGGNSRAVFEYFIGYKLGLTATPKDYLKNINPDALHQNDPRELERRIMLDTYKTFGCELGEPTFRYSLIDGVRDGFLINPVVADARTEITTQLLSDKGYAVEITKEATEEISNEEQKTSQEQVFKQTDFEKSFFSENTNKVFCQTFMENALRDPVTNEIGKTIFFCVSQNHAAKMAQILNEIAHKMYPGKYNSDFALQVTSFVQGAQDFTRSFSSNKLNGRSRFNEFYLTSKTRVCCTVGMMTTGYDCPDILNLCLARPIFSPTDFIQIKGRGTRKHDFSSDLQDDRHKAELGKVEKTKFKVFDFFANFEYFEEKFDYDEILELPKTPGKRKTNNESVHIDGLDSTNPDQISTSNEIAIGQEGMKIDRMYFQSFEEKILKEPELKAKVEKGQIEEVVNHIQNHVLEKPTEFFTLEKLRKSINSDRRVSLREIIEWIFGLVPYIKSKQELLEEEFDRFDTKYMPDRQYFDHVKEIFFAYITDKEFRDIVDSGMFGNLNLTPYAESFRLIPAPWRLRITEYIKDNVNITNFAA